jgi:hypothetical protein
MRALRPSRSTPSRCSSGSPVGQVAHHPRQGIPVGRSAEGPDSPSPFAVLVNGEGRGGAAVVASRGVVARRGAVLALSCVEGMLRPFSSYSFVLQKRLRLGISCCVWYILLYGRKPSKGIQLPGSGRHRSDAFSGHRPGVLPGSNPLCLLLRFLFSVIRTFPGMGEIIMITTRFPAWFSFDRMAPLGYNFHPSLSRASTGTASKTPAVKPLFGVLQGTAKDVPPNFSDRLFFDGSNFTDQQEAVILLFGVRNAQANLSTQDPAACACPRLPPAHVHRRWTPGAQAAPPQGPHPPHRPQQFARKARPLVGTAVSRFILPAGEGEAQVKRSFRLTRSTDIKRVRRSGKS